MFQLFPLVQFLPVPSCFVPYITSNFSLFIHHFSSCFDSLWLFVPFPLPPPGKILFRRSHVRDVAMKRLRFIDDYCRVKSSRCKPPHSCSEAFPDRIRVQTFLPRVMKKHQKYSLNTFSLFTQSSTYLESGSKWCMVVNIFCKYKSERSHLHLGLFPFTLIPLTKI